MITNGYEILKVASLLKGQWFESLRRNVEIKDITTNNLFSLCIQTFHINLKDIFKRHILHGTKDNTKVSLTLE